MPGRKLASRDYLELKGLKLKLGQAQKRGSQSQIQERLIRLLRKLVLKLSFLFKLLALSRLDRQKVLGLRGL